MIIKFKHQNYKDLIVKLTDWGRDWSIVHKTIMAKFMLQIAGDSEPTLGVTNVRYLTH